MSTRPEDGDRAPAVSVVVPTRDRAGRLSALLSALARQTLPADRFEVIVVDDRSRDDTRAVLRRASGTAPFSLHALAGPGKGPAAARNAGWRAATAPLVAFTDDDCEPAPRWLEVGTESAAANPGSIIQGRTRPLPREATQLGPLSRTKWIDGPGPWFQTCNIFYPRRLLERAGGFDERFTRPFGEDTDLAWRALALGASVRFEPGALVHHAVARLGPRAFLRAALRDPDEALVFKRHPRLRREVSRLGIFKSDHHGLLMLAAVAVVVGRRHAVAVALTMPYLLHVAARCRAVPEGPALVPVVIAHDAIEVLQAGRGAVRHRVPLL